jgi:heat shock protein HslJ
MINPAIENGSNEFSTNRKGSVMRFSLFILPVVMMLVLPSSIFTVYPVSDGDTPSDSVSSALKDSLTGTMWMLAELDNPLPDSRPFAIGRPYLMFETDTTSVSGWGGCNRFSGSVTADREKRIQFGRLTSTRMECPDTDLETDFLQALQNSVTFELDRANNLNLYDASGSLVARFKPEDS